MANKNSKSRILTIDDNPAIHEDFRKILVSDSSRQDLDEAAANFFGVEETIAPGKLDAELDSALQGKEGYEMVKKAVEEGRPYTLAFCDMRMPPGWDGLTTIEHLWKVDPNLQVVICSAYSDNTWADISNRLGQSDRLLILKKPFDNAEVLQIAVALIEKRRLIEAANLRREELEQSVEDRTKKLAAAREDSERLIDAIDSVLIQIDNNNIVRRWNHNAVNLFRISPEQAIGAKFDELPIIWDNQEDVTKLILQGETDTSQRVNANLKPTDEESRCVNIAIYPISFEGKFQGRLILASDHTDQKMLEQQLHQAQKLESVGQLAAGVAHEINTPMQYLSDNLHYVTTKFEQLKKYLTESQEFITKVQRGMVEADAVDAITQITKELKLEKLARQIPEALGDSADGVAHVAKIVKAMKELSHPGGDQKTLVDINKSIRSTVTVSTNEWKYYADVELELEDGLAPVMGFPSELNQVFLNLIVNAAHAISEMQQNDIDEKGKITFRTSECDGFVNISIQDTGGGIPVSIRNRVFDPFFTTKEIGVGTGQGLAISHNVIVNKHGGNIGFEVEENVGTTFKISLPIEAAQQQITEQNELETTLLSN